MPVPYRIFSLGDSAITLDFGNLIDETINQHIINLFYNLSKEPLPGMIEAVPAYSSVTIYYDPFELRKIMPVNKTAGEWMIELFEQRVQLPLLQNDASSQFIKIPVCYEKEYGLDIEEIAKEKNVSADEVINIHLSKTYRVYMLGFLPGFSYMGQIDERIEMPRKIQPRQKVEAGSVGIAGKQTGIYPLASPGGWQIIGRTPLKLFDAGIGNNEHSDSICLLHPGDTVQFYSINKDEFKSY